MPLSAEVPAGVVAVELSSVRSPSKVIIARATRCWTGYCYWSGSSSGCQTARKAGFLNDRPGFLEERETNTGENDCETCLPRGFERHKKRLYDD